MGCFGSAEGGEHKDKKNDDHGKKKGHDKDKDDHGKHKGHDKDDSKDKDDKKKKKDKH